VKLAGRVAVITGGASGIGFTLAERFKREGATVVISDRREDALAEAARRLGVTGIPADVRREDDIKNLIQAVIEQHGRVDLFCSNAGLAMDGDEHTPDKHWQLIHEVHVMSHVYAARHVLPHMLERGEGYLLNTASAAGLLTELQTAPYAVTKHAALAFAEWLAIRYHDRGIRVSCLCPEGVHTPMIEQSPMLQRTAISTDQVADAVVQALDEERFLITTHPTTLPSFQQKATDYEGWLTWMRKLSAKYVTGTREAGA